MVAKLGHCVLNCKTDDICCIFTPPVSWMVSVSLRLVSLKWVSVSQTTCCFSGEYERLWNRSNVCSHDFSHFSTLKTCESVFTWAVKLPVSQSGGNTCLLTPFRPEVCLLICFKSLESGQPVKEVPSSKFNKSFKLKLPKQYDHYYELGHIIWLLIPMHHCVNNLLRLDLRFFNIQCCYSNVFTNFRSDWICWLFCLHHPHTDKQCHILLSTHYKHFIWRLTKTKSR